MSEETYKRLSRKGRRRARKIQELESIIYIVLIVISGFLAANGIGLLFRTIGV